MRYFVTCEILPGQRRFAVICKYSFLEICMKFFKFVEQPCHSTLTPRWSRRPAIGRHAPLPAHRPQPVHGLQDLPGEPRVRDGHRHLPGHSGGLDGDREGIPRPLQHPPRGHLR